MAADHEGFADLDSGAGAHGEQSFGLCFGQAEGFFAENVFAGLGGFYCPGNVKLVGKRIVNGVDVGIGEKLFVGAVGGGNGVGGRGLRAFARSRDAIATTLEYSPCCMAGMTFLETDRQC